MCFIFLIMAILIVVRWYLTIVLVFISLMISDVEHLFIYLLGICIPSFEKCLFRFFAHFKIRTFISCCWLSSLYILNINLLSDIWFTNLFSPSIGCLFTLLVVSFSVLQVFSLMRSHFSIFAFVACVFGSHPPKNMPRPISKSFPYVSF